MSGGMSKRVTDAAHILLECVSLRFCFEESREEFMAAAKQEYAMRLRREQGYREVSASQSLQRELNPLTHNP